MNTTMNTSLAPITKNKKYNFTLDDQSVLISISQISSNIIHLWKIRAVVTYEYPKRTFMYIHGNGEVSIWDLNDLSGSTNLVAFNLN
ncbi:unnamed protein product [Rotaria sp. Silwood2]|nr:unnamed protein product [Rotaria sp. Silwood2]